MALVHREGACLCSSMFRSLRARLHPAAFLLAAVCLLAGCAPAAAPPAQEGTIDLRRWDFGRDGIATLDGQWQLQWDEFGQPSDTPAAGQAIQVPGDWNKAVGTAYGRATYRVTVLCERGNGLALSLPVQHSAAQWFVNGALVARQGQPGASARGARAASIQQTVPLGSVACPLQITAHVSNFDMRRGGMLRSVELGEVEQLAQRRELALMRDQLAIGGLLVLGLMPLLFFLGRRNDRSPLWFGLFCLVFALGMGMSGSRVLQPVFAHLPWDRYLQAIFLCWYGNNILFTLFVRSLYPGEVGLRAVRIIGAWVLLSVAVVLATHARTFTLLLPSLMVGSCMVGMYLAWRLLAAWRHGRRSAPLLLAGLAVLTATVVHDVANYAHLTRLTLVPYGVLLFVAAPAYLMARRFARALSLEERVAIEQRGRANLLVRSTKAGLLDWDTVSNRIEWSDRLGEMLGQPAGADAPERPEFWSFVHPADVEQVQDSMRRQLRDRSVRSGIRPGEAMDYRLRAPDGSWLWVHAEGVSVCDADGRMLRFICSFIDISDRKRHEEEMDQRLAEKQRAELALRAQVELTRTEQRRLDLVVRGARVGIVDWDGVTHETYYSPRFRVIRGYAPDAETSDWPDYFKVMIHPDDRERVTRRWVTFIKGKGPEGPRGDFYAPEEYRLLRADGSYVWVEVSGMAVRDERDFVVRWIAAIVDITERREQREQLQRQNDTLKENVRLREEVERIGRHDIKTPLNSIVSVPRLLREERRLGPEADELLGIVERAGYRILSMVNLSLDLYKMEQGSYVFRPDAVDLADLVDKVLADVRVHAASKEVRFAVDLEGAPYAWAEELLCYSLLANLVKNAVEASPEGEQVHIRARAGADSTVRIEVHNQGAVPVPIRASFFQKYATLGKASGTGLGTYSARLMATVQDGDIAMRTSEQDGTTLAVTLRAAPAGVIPASVRHAGERDRAQPLRVTALPATRVLLVDDDEYNLLIVRRFLPAPPFTVDTAINGRMALAAAEREWPDVIFMDLDMPVMGGMQAVGELRALERAGRRRCTIVALSSHEDETTREAALAAGFDRYLAKPVTRDVLHATLLELLLAQPQGAGSPVRRAAPVATATDPVLVDADVEAMMPGYLASRRKLLATLPGLAGNREALRQLAHQLAGSFGVYGFTWAADQCHWLEKNAAAVDAARVASLAAELQAHLETADIRFVVDDPIQLLEKP